MTVRTAGRRQWWKSSFSGPQGGDCVEVTLDSNGPHMSVRDSRHPDLLNLSFPATEWRAFLVDVGRDEF
ncbi:DUF397 domain-containing protein [Marinactinospora rubrisoli]|uniref:DUF397 domain-containing protein n=1 Tax=Marinactinospora rubrisoli TaxID=2715399 RepID=A0ABW2KND0_9ACTN